jgi:hypothetical protein
MTASYCAFTSPRVQIGWVRSARVAEERMSSRVRMLSTWALTAAWSGLVRALASPIGPGWSRVPGSSDMVNLLGRMLGRFGSV